MIKSSRWTNVRRAHGRRDVLLSSRAARNLFANGGGPSGAVQPHMLAEGAGLTRREADVVGFLAGGATNRQISRQPDLLGLDDMPPRSWVNRLLQECAATIPDQ